MIWPGIECMHVSCSLEMSYDYELPFGERALLSGLVQLTRPRLIFEFGTFTGLTTRLLADAAPRDAKVHTIDQPESSFPAGGFEGWYKSDMVGSHFVGDDRYSDTIVLHRADLRTFDFSAFHGRVDLVFIDAGHTYDNVIRDSQIAFELLAPSGTIVWDDYHAHHWGVVRALNEIADHHPLWRIMATRFVVHQS
jgi:predicted O-methyltransferase YrrM